jgi:squalene-hopene/tetraprenyl-beta-curcumene cyclase
MSSHKVFVAIKKQAALNTLKQCLPAGLASILILLVGATASAGEGPSDWKPDRAARYLDEREQAWFAFDSRGQGSTKSTCVSCHSVLPYALARPALRKLGGGGSPAEWETRLLAQTRMRVENWPKLDSEAFGLFYDESDRKKTESWGTEAVFNALILAFDDRYQGRSSPSPATKQAFVNLWQAQLQKGENKGAWEWLDFHEAPWGNAEARYFGAALAAIAVRTAPGYYSPGADTKTDAQVDLLRRYLKEQFSKRNLHDRAWALWASTCVDDVLTGAERQTVIDQLLAKQRSDGGWSLPSLGAWVRNDRSAQDNGTDGYATAFVLHVLQTAGLPKDHANVAKGLTWLRENQAASGAWRSVSLVKKRDPATHTGKFMSDAATAFAVLALCH